MSKLVIKKKLYKGLLTLCFCFWQSFISVAKIESTALSNGVAVVVNKNIISTRDLYERLRLAALFSGLQDTAENLNKIKPAILRTMIDEQLQVQAAAAFNLEVSPEEVKAAIENIEKASSLPPGGLKKALEANKIPFGVMENQLRAGLLWVRYIQEKYIPFLQTSEKEVDQYLRRLQSNQDKTQYHLAEIVLYLENPQQEQKVKEAALKLRALLEQGAPFQGVAQQFSQAPTSAQGGVVGWVVAQDLEKALEGPLQQQKVGEVSGPWRTVSGFTILFLLDKRTPKKGEKRKLPPREDVLQILQSERLGLFARQELSLLRSKAFVEIR